MTQCHYHPLEPRIQYQVKSLEVADQQNSSLEYLVISHDSYKEIQNSRPPITYNESPIIMQDQSLSKFRRRETEDEWSAGPITSDESSICNQNYPERDDIPVLVNKFALHQAQLKIIYIFIILDILS